MKAEERGQAEAIAFNLREMSRLETPLSRASLVKVVRAVRWGSRSPTGWPC